jgi:hypothetical protein
LGSLGGLGGINGDPEQASKTMEAGLYHVPSAVAPNNEYRVVNLTGLTGKAKDYATAWAINNNAVTADTKDMAALHDIQRAQDNITSVMSSVEQFLPQDPTQRAWQGSTNTLAKIFQTNPALGSFDSWRTAAIANLRATAGSGGLRINQREIELAVANDLPKITDTVEVARQKMQHLQDMLENALRPLGARDWRTGDTGPRQWSPSTSTAVRPMMGQKTGATTAPATMRFDPTTGTVIPVGR